MINWGFVINWLLDACQVLAGVALVASMVWIVLALIFNWG